MANIINKYLDEIDELKDEIEDEAEQILENIDIDILMRNPEKFLEEFGKQYYEAHLDVIERAIDIGENQARRIIKTIVKA